MNRSALTILMLSVLWLNCPSYIATITDDIYYVTTVHDDFDGYTKNTLVHNKLGGGGLGASIHLLIQRFEAKDGSIKYALIVKYFHSDWLFIREGESLILLIDGERCGFTGEGSSAHRSVGSGGIVVEYAYYDTTPEILNKIAYANEVRIKIVGSQYYTERHFTKENFDFFRQYLKEYVNVTPEE